MMYNLRRHDALARGGGRGDYSTFERSKSPARRRSSASAPASRPPSPAPPSPSHAIILPARRGRIYLLIAGVAIFTPAVVAALFFITLVVLLLASSHFGGCGGQADYRGRAALAPSYHAANCYGIWSSWANICSLCHQDETVFARDLCLVKHIYGGSDQLNALAPTTRRVNSASPAPGEWTRRNCKKESPANAAAVFDRRSKWKNALVAAARLMIRLNPYPSVSAVSLRANTARPPTPTVIRSLTRALEWTRLRSSLLNRAQ